MKFPKPVAILLIVGFFIHALAVPPAPIQASSVETVETRGPAGSRASLPSVSQESESIDSFNVHPENRWSDGTSGTFAEDLENGEFSIQGFDNTSSSNLRYRDAETTSGDIETRWRLNASDSDAGDINGSDFEALLMGLNITTDEGSGNSSLNAYYYNSTHYVLRPTFTTADGSNWRSWNIESDYQEHFQMDGTKGADGIDFIEGTEGVSYTGAAGTASLGVLVVDTAGAPFQVRVRFLALNDLPTANYDFLSIKIRTNVSDINIEPYTENGITSIGSIQNVLTSWSVIDWDLSGDPDWTGTLNGITFKLDEFGGDGQLEDDNFFWIDYIHLTSNNDSSDLTFFEYESYYRAQMKYDLMESTLNWKISDDSDNKLTSTVQGSFKIEDFFPTDELIRDISLGTVGDTDYFFGLRSAGANATTWWDFYKADFTEFNFELAAGEPTEAGGDTWESEAPYSAYTVNDGGAATTVTAGYQLIVPEFDSCSGRLTNFENGTNSIGGVALALLTVDAADGATNLLLAVTLEGGDIGGVAFDAAHRMRIEVAGVPQSFYDLDDNRDSDISFSVYLDKQLRKMTLQTGFVNSSGAPITLTFTADLGAGASNEVLLFLSYIVIFNAVATNEVHLAVTEWDLIFRDLFGIPLPLPDIGDAIGSAVPSDPISFLLQAFRDLAGLMAAAGQSLVLTVAVLGTVLNQLILILAKLTAMAIDINTLTGMVATLTAIAANIVIMTTDLGNIATGIVTITGTVASLLVDTGLMQSDIFAIASGIASIASDVGDVPGIFTAIGEVLDSLTDILGDSWLGQIFDVLFALAVDVALKFVEKLIAEAIALLAAVLDAMISYFRDITVAGVSIGDLIDFIDAWMVNFWTIADSIISLGTEVLTVWTQVFLMGLLGIILIWAAASAQRDGELFVERFTTAMNYDVNPVGFILTIRIPLGVILLGNLFWVVFTDYDWEGFLIPAFVMASWQLGARYETPDYSDAMDDFFEYTTSVLEDILDTLLDEVAGTMWKTLVTLLSDDILGASPEVIVFVVTAGIAATILIRGKF